MTAHDKRTQTTYARYRVEGNQVTSYMHLAHIKKKTINSMYNYNISCK